jgi:phosphotransferase system enzyme I (PtsP)
MNLPRELAAIIAQRHSLDAILEAAVGLVARQMGCEAWIFLLDPEPRLRLGAAFGGRAGASAGVAAELAAQSIERRALATKTDPSGTLSGVPMVLRSRPIGAIVVRRVDPRRFSVEDCEVLTRIAAQLVGVVANALLIEALDRGKEPPALLLGSALGRLAPAAGEVVVQGTAASPGVGIGRAVFRGIHELSAEVRAAPSKGASVEKARLRDALVKTRNEITKLQRAAARDIDEEHALIFSSHLLVMNDPALLDRIDAALARGASAPVAIDEALTDLERRIRGVPDAYVQERVDDIDDLRGRLLGHTLEGGARARSREQVLVTKRFPPSLVIELKAERAQGIIAEVGGTTSHGALLARALGVPTVTGVVDLVDLVGAGDALIVDGTSGKVVIRPTDETLGLYRELAERALRLRNEHARYRDQPFQTADGARVTMLANVAVASDLANAKDNGAEGIGLYRTEFPFIVREQFPTREEQARIHSKAYEAFPDGPINFRILDLGGDKFLPGGTLAAARSPFHGYRGIRVLFDHPHVVHDQVQAFARAARGRPLSILVPMVSSMEELRQIRELVAEALDALPRSEARPVLSFGAMIEVPAAVELAGDIAREVDYLSIGTNDLVQYSLVADREDARMKSATDDYHPAILRMARRTVLAAHAAGKRVSVCGEMAARKGPAALLVALGVDALSVVPSAIPELKQAFASLKIARLREAIDDVLALPDALSIQQALAEHLAAEG